jgi:predicted chitinase
MARRKTVKRKVQLGSVSQSITVPAGPALAPLDQPTITGGISLMDRWRMLPQRTKYLVYGGAAAILFVALFRRQIVSTASGLVSKLVTLKTITTVMPGINVARATAYLPHLTEAMEEAAINTPLRIAAFLSQLGHESGNFKYMEELADGSAYEGRKDLGNTQPGDGKKFKGRGPIQITGRANYEKFGKAVGQDFTSSLEAAKKLATPEWGFKAAAWFWNMRNLNVYADKGDFQAITYRINGGCNGADDRDKRYAFARKELGIEGAPLVQ